MRGFVLTSHDDTIELGVQTVPEPDGEVVLEVAYSAMNFKDDLVAQPRSRVRRADRLIMGVEAAGRVRSSRDPRFELGDEAIVFGGVLGVGIDGGFAEYVTSPARYVSKIPTSFVFHSRQAMIYGLAGYTAMASLLALEDHGLTPDDGDVVVTGATGGVGSLAVVMLARRGYRVVASTGSEQHAAWLRDLGAAEVIGRDEIADRADRVLASERWAGAIDCVGAASLHAILRSLRYGGAVAASGLVAGAQLETTVYPFITRNVALLGIDAVESSIATRDRVWSAIRDQASSDDEYLVERTLSLKEIPDGLEALRSGATRGRWLVDPSITS